MADQNPWEINYSPVSGAPPSPPQSTTGYAFKGLAGTEPIVLPRVMQQAAAASSAGGAKEPWEIEYQTPPAPPPQPSPVAKAGSAFWEGIGGPQWAPIVKALSNPSLSNPDAPDALAAVWNMAKGLAAEPGRVWNELGNTGAAMLKGDPLGAAYHLAGSVPLFGAPAQQVAQDLQRGDPAAAVGHTGAIIAPLVAGPAAELAGPAIAATGRGLETAAKVARGAAGGAFDAATEMVPFRKFGIPISVPKPLVTGPAGAAAAAALGLPRELGGVVGAASPIVAGAVRGARAALAERAAQAAAAAEEAPIGPPAIAPRLALPPAAIVTPAPADTSFVRGVPAEYALPEPLPLSRQLPPGTDLRQMPAAGDTSYVRAIPAEYPPVEPGFAPEQPASGGTAATPPAPAAPTPTPGQLYAESTGEDWAKLSPKNRALMEQIAQARANVAAQPEATPPAAAPQIAPQTPPAAPEPPAPPPTAPPTPEAPAPRLSSQDLARQLEASMRVETLTDYLVRSKVPGAMLDNFGDKEWKMVADQAGVQPPSAENIQAIRGNLADYEGAAQITAKTPAEAAAEFAQNRSIRTKRQAPAAPADLEGQLADSVAAVQKGERPAAAPPPDEPAALTASEKRVEAFAQHLAADKSVTSAQLANLPSNPQALALLEQLGESLDIEGRPAPGEPQAIVDRVRELRGEPAGAAPQATIEPDAQSTPATGPAAGKQPGSSGTPVPGSRQPMAPVARGDAVTVRVPGESTTYQGQYAVRELDDIYASHNAHTFQKNPDYYFQNDRDYSNPTNKERVVVNSKAFDPAYPLADSPDATHGAPVIDPDGNVLGGNSRAMILDRVYSDNPAGAEAYRAELARRAPRYGIDPALVAGMKRPVLVRELAPSEGNPQRAITDLNKTGTAALTAAERATADARTITPAAADYLTGAIEAEGGDATLKDVLSGKRGAAIINKLVDDGVFTMQEKPNLIDARTGSVTAAGKERIEKMLLGRVFESADQMTRTPLELRAKIERVVAPVLRSGQKTGFDLLPTLRQSIDLMEYARAHGIPNLRDAIAQESIFGDAPKISPAAVDLAEFLRDNKPTEVSKAFRRYIANAEPGMFGESTPAEAFADAFGTASPPETLGDLMQPKAAARKRRAK